MRNLPWIQSQLVGQVQTRAMTSKFGGPLHRQLKNTAAAVIFSYFPFNGFTIFLTGQIQLISVIVQWVRAFWSTCVIRGAFGTPVEAGETGRRKQEKENITLQRGLFTQIYLLIFINRFLKYLFISHISHQKNVIISFFQKIISNNKKRTMSSEILRKKSMLVQDLFDASLEFAIVENSY